MSPARIKKGFFLFFQKNTPLSGKVMEILTKKERVLVEKLNMVKRHMRHTQKDKQGGILEKEAPLALSVVMPLCPKCNEGVRVKTKIGKDGSKMRVCVACEEKLDSKGKK